MSLNSLKIFAGHIITMSEMHKSAKLQLLNYVEEADEYQVKALLLDGEIMREPRDIVCEEIDILDFSLDIEKRTYLLNNGYDTTNLFLKKLK